VPKRKSFRPKAESDALRLTRGYFYVLETFERANRLRRARAFQANIELNGFFACSRTGVGDVGANGHLGVRRALRVTKTVVQRSRAQLSRARLRRSVAEARIGKSVAKRKLRTILLVDIARNIFVRGDRRRLREVRVSRWTSRIQRVVVQRFLTDAARPSHGKLTVWIRFSIEYTHQCRTGLDARKPRGENCRHMFERPGKRERSSAEQHQDDRFSSSNYRFQEIFLLARQPEISSRSSFTSHGRSVFAQRKYHRIRVLRDLDGFGQLLVRCVSDVAALRVPHMVRAQLLG